MPLEHGTLMDLAQALAKASTQALDETKLSADHQQLLAVIRGESMRLTNALDEAAQHRRRLRQLLETALRQVIQDESRMGQIGPALTGVHALLSRLGG